MKKPYIFGAGAAVAVLAVAYFVLLPMFKGKATPAPASAAAAGALATPHPYRAHHETAEIGLMYPLAERLLNLASTGDTPHYARIQITIEFARPAGAPAKTSSSSAVKDPSATPVDPLLKPVQDHSAQLDDALVRIAGAMTMETMTSQPGQDALKQKLLAAVAEIVPGLDPINAYIQQLVVQ